MPELIDRIELRKDFCNMCEAMQPEMIDCEKKGCMSMQIIDDQPTIDAEPVRHGRWINDVFCSECKRFPVDVSVSISNRELTKYFSRCPHCGARMDGGADNGFD